MSGIATIEENNVRQPSCEYPHEFRIRFRLWHSLHVAMTRSLPGPSGSGTCPVWLCRSADRATKTSAAARDRIDRRRALTAGECTSTMSVFAENRESGVHVRGSLERTTVR
jgi:hypothetical protein